MDLDLRTLSVVVAVAYVLQTLAIAVLYTRNKKYAGIRWWALGSGMTALGFILFLVRDFIQLALISIILPNALVIAGAIGIYLGIMLFLERTVNRSLVFLVFALFIALYFYFTYAINDINSRTVIVSVTLAFYQLLTVRELLRKPVRAIADSSYFIAGVLFSEACFYLFRTVSVLTFAPVQNLFSPTLIQTLVFLVSFAGGILLSFGLIFMVNQRLNAEVTDARDHFETIFNTNPDGVVISRLDNGIIVDINEGITNLTGFTRNEVIGSSVFDNGFWKNPDDIHTIVNDFLKKGHLENVEIALQRKDGSGIAGMVSARMTTLHDVPHILSVIRDVTDRRKAEEALRESEERYRAFFESSIDGIMITSPDGSIEAANAEACRMLGMTEEELITGGRNLVVDPADARLKAALEERERAGRWRGELDFRRKDGTIFPADDSTVIFTDSSGKKKTVMAIRDITERKLAEDALRESEERFRVLTQNLQSAVSLIDEHGAFSIVNASFLRMFGIPADADILNVNSQDWARWQVFDEDGTQLDVDQHPVRKAALTGRAVKNQLVAMKSPSGPDLKWLLISAEPILDAHGGIHLIICTYYDITNRKKAEEALKESEEHFRALTTASSDVVYRMSPDWSEMRQLRGQSFLADTEKPDRNWLQVYIHPDDQERVKAVINEAIRTKSIFELEHRVLRVDGTAGWTFSRAVPLLDKNGEIFEWFGAANDITDRRKAEEALKESRNQLAGDLEAMQMLQKLSVLYVSGGNLEPILTEIVRAAIAITGADFGNIQLLDPGSSELRIAAQQGFPDWWLDYWNSVSKGKGTCGTALGRGERVIVEDVEQSPIFAGTPALGIQLRAGVRAVQSTPLMSREGKPLGMFSTHFRVPHRPSDRQLRLLDLLARQAADIIERTQSEKALLMKNDDLSALNEELSRREQDLNKALAEKEVLLSEIHHRVKNNLTAFISLLSLEGSTEETPGGLELKKDLQNRARSMALIHETLYRTHQFSEVDMDVYLTPLIDQIVNSYSSPQSISTIVEAKGVTLDLARATPCGLIVNELVTNSFKHAFPKDVIACRADQKNPCTVRIRLTKENGSYLLSVCDNGIGLQAGFDPMTAKSLGLKLVTFLAKHQMRSKIEVNATQGTEFIFRFRE